MANRIELTGVDFIGPGKNSKCDAPVLAKPEAKCSGSEAVAAIGMGKNAHHFMEVRNLEVQN